MQPILGCQAKVLRANLCFLLKISNLALPAQALLVSGEVCGVKKDHPASHPPKASDSIGHTLISH